MQGTVIGRLGADPETKTLDSGRTVTEVRIAVTRKRGSDETTTWYRCALWGPRGEAFARFHKKGDLAAIHGEAYTREWTDKQGNTRLSVEVDAHGWTFAQTRQDREAANPDREDIIPF